MVQRHLHRLPYEAFRPREIDPEPHPCLAQHHVQAVEKHRNGGGKPETVRAQGRKRLVVVLSPGACGHIQDIRMREEAGPCGLDLIEKCQRPFTLKGEHPPGLHNEGKNTSLVFETLMTGSADEPAAAY
eukprot:gene21947-21904_t